MFIHDLLKIKYSEEGYLPNYPYRLITDKEMFDAFLLEDEGYFAINYPCIDESLRERYDELLDAIKYHIDNYLINNITIPSWVYSFMIGAVISINTDEQEIEYLYTLMNLPVKQQFTLELAESCYQVSDEWVKKLPAKYDHRPPSVFGELHVVKSLRLTELDVVNGGG